MSVLDDPKLEAMAARLCMGRSVLEPLTRMPHAHAQEKITALKRQLKSRYKQAALDLHPDRNPDDPKAGEKFALLVRVKEILEGIRVEGQRPSPNYGAMDVTGMSNIGFADMMAQYRRDMDERLRQARERRVQDFAKAADRERAAKVDAKSKKGRIKANAARVKARVDADADKTKIHRPTAAETKEHGSKAKVAAKKLSDLRYENIRNSIRYTSFGFNFSTPDYEE